MDEGKMYLKDSATESDPWQPAAWQALLYPLGFYLLWSFAMNWMHVFLWDIIQPSEMAILVGNLFSVALAYLGCRLLGKALLHSDARQMRLAWPRRGLGYFLLALVPGLVLLLFSLLAPLFIASTGYLDEYAMLLFVQGASPLLLNIAVSIPLFLGMEFCRGFMLRGPELRWGKWPALLLVSAIFVIGAYLPYLLGYLLTELQEAPLETLFYLASQFTFHLLLSLLAWDSASIWPGALLYVLANAANYLPLYFMGENALFFDAATLVGGVLGIVLLTLYQRRRQEKETELPVESI